MHEMTAALHQADAVGQVHPLNTCIKLVRFELQTRPRPWAMRSDADASKCRHMDGQAHFHD